MAGSRSSVRGRRRSRYERLATYPIANLANSRVGDRNRSLSPDSCPLPLKLKPMPDLDDARRTLRDVFGFAEFREGQEAVIGRLLTGRSCLAIFPTGGGKSLVYQLPALLLNGLTVVVSPLIALMKDQVDFLVKRGVAAARLDSSLELSEVQRIHRDLRSGRLKILYIAPERLASERFVETLSGQSIALLAIDEAHCISEWGHNFRPEYLKLARLAERLQVGRVLGLTATATPGVARNIAQAFHIDPTDIVRTDFHRPNLFLECLPCRSSDRYALLLERLAVRTPGPAILYVTLQRTAEELAAFLVEHGHDAVAYHAGLDDDRRHQIQDAFMASDKQLVVATIAFGMGIDKANIRGVYHVNLPKGPENYAQEIGRAGRDGRPSECVLFACAEDVVTLENFTYGDTPTPEAIASCLDDVFGRGDVFDVSLYELSQSHDIRQLVVQTLLTYLELEGVLEPTGPFYSEYKVQFVRPFEEIVGRFDPNRADFLRRVFAEARRGRIWQTLEAHEAAATLGEPRDRIIKALNYLEEQGELIVKPAGVRQGYRRTSPGTAPGKLSESLTDRFRDRERREIERIQRMLAFAGIPGCLTRRLLEYFGEDFPTDCGHCGPCQGRPPAPVPEPDRRPLGDPERQIVQELRADRHAALSHPRQLTRFLCGLSSPATTRPRLTRHPRFGALRDVPFLQTLKLVETTMDR